MRSKAKKQCKCMLFVLAQIKILSKAREFYMKGLENCASKVGYGGVMGYPIAQVSSLPKSFNVNSFKETEQYRELLGMVLLNIHRQHDMNSNYGIVRSTYSVGIGKIGRIDEDKPCSFGEDDIDVKVELYHSTSTHGVKNSVVYH